MARVAIAVIGVQWATANAGPFGSPGTFGVSPTGAATYSLPLAVAPGSAGATPDLALVYSSQAGDSPFGVGWQLRGVSIITRCPRTVQTNNVRGAVGLNDNDRFCLDGQPLVLTAGTYGASGATYRTEIESFARITSFGRTGKGPDWFKVEYRDGTIAEFGRDAMVYESGSSTSASAVARGSKLLTSAASTSREPNTAISWAINKRSDRAGNTTRYVYWNSWDYDSFSQTWLQRQLLESISYTENQNAGHGAYAYVRFNYEPRWQVNNPWRDIRRTFGAGYGFLNDWRVASIDNGYFLSSGSEVLAKRFALKYDTSGTNSRSLLVGVQECAVACTYLAGGNVSSTSAATSATATQDVPSTFSYYAGTSASLSAFEYRSLSAAYGAYTNYQYWKPLTGDFDGDGRTDVLWSNESTAQRRLWTKVGEPGGTQVFNNLAAKDGSLNGWKAAVSDFNNDGRSDIVFYPINGNPGYWMYVWLSNGDGTFNPLEPQLLTHYQQASLPLHNTFEPSFGDFDGDGRVDILWTLQNFVGSGAGIRIIWKGAGNGTFTQTCDGGPTCPLSGEAYTVGTVGDFNGDGRSDLFVVNVSTGNNTRWVYLADPESSSGFTKFSNVAGRDGQGTGDRYLFDDFNGDGNTDVFIYSALTDGRTTGFFAFWISRGDGTFEMIHNPGGMNQDARLLWSVPLAGDFDGDGFADLVFDARDSGNNSTGSRVFAIGSGSALAWTIYENVAGANPYTAYGWPVPGDFDGDGKLDILFDGKFADGTSRGVGLLFRNTFGVTASAGQTYQGQAIVDRVVGVTDLLREVREGSGRRHTVEYLPLTNNASGGAFYWKTRSATFPEVISVPARQAVRISGSLNGLGDTFNYSSYSYQNAVANLWRNIPLGFEASYRLDWTSLAQKNVIFATSWPYSGMITREEEYRYVLEAGAYAPKLVRWRSDELALSPNSRTNSPACPSRVAVTWPYTERSIYIERDLNQIFVARTTTEHCYDDDANLLRRDTASQTESGASDGYWRSEVAEYDAKDVATWRFGLAKCLSVISTAPGQAQPGAGVRRRALSYDRSTFLLASETIEPDANDTCSGVVSNNPALRVRIDYVRDAYGNVTKKTHSTSLDPSHPSYFAPRTTSWDYQNLFPIPAITNVYRGRFPVVETNALDQKTVWGRDEIWGRPTWKSRDSLLTTWTYSPLGSVLSEVRPDGTRTDHSYTLCDASCGTAWIGRGYIRSDVSTGEPSRFTFLDYLDRPTRPKVAAADGAAYDLRGAVEYDALGRITKRFNGCREELGTCTSFAQTTFDALDRPVTVLDQDGFVTSYEYVGRTTRIRTPRATAGGYYTEEERDGRGHLTRVSQAVGTGRQTLLRLTYDEFGNLRIAARDGGTTRTSTYDVYGRRTSLVDPDTGTSTQTYNALGELVKDAAANGTLTAISYDKLGRIIRTTLTANSTQDDSIEATYDTAAINCPAGGATQGRLTELKTASKSIRRFCFDSVGRASAEFTTTDNDTARPNATPQSVAYSYDTASRLAQRIYSKALPGGASLTTLNYDYSAAGYLSRIKDATRIHWESLAWDYDGRTVSERLGKLPGDASRPGLRADFEFHGRGMVKKVTGRPDGTPGGITQTYLYDGNGNLTQRGWWYVTDRTESFTYDELDRLSGISGASTKNFGYDLEGNLTQKDGNVLAYGPLNVRPHAVTSVTRAADGVTSYYYQYDASGNMLAECPSMLCSSPTRTFNWTADSLLKKVIKGAASSTFWYGGDRARVAQEVDLSGVKSQLFYGPDGYERAVSSGGTVEQNKVYIRVRDRIVGSINLRSNVPTEYRYHLTDQLGSPVTTVDDTAQAYEWEGFDGWGKRRNADGTDNAGATSYERRGFTGHEHLDLTNLIHMNGRVYEPSLGRFLSPDPLVTDWGDSQSYNRYSYVRNRPLSATDVTGHEDNPLVIEVRGYRPPMSDMYLDMLRRQLEFNLPIQLGMYPMGLGGVPLGVVLFPGPPIPIGPVPLPPNLTPGRLQQDIQDKLTTLGRLAKNAQRAAAFALAAKFPVVAAIMMSGSDANESASDDGEVNSASTPPNGGDEDPKKGDLKAVKEKKLENDGIDAHKVKKDFVGNQGGRYNISVDSKTGEVYLTSVRRGAAEPVNTGLRYGDLAETYPLKRP